MRADVLERLSAIASGEFVAVPGGTPGTLGTARALTARVSGTPGPVPGHVPDRKSPLFRVFQAFQVECDEFAVAERAAIAVEDGQVPPVYADAWAVFQTRQPRHATEAEWLCAVNDGGRFLDEWAGLAFDFGWRPLDIFDQRGLAWFCRGERVRALGPYNAVTTDGRVFTRITANLIGRRGAASRSNPSPDR